MPIKPLTHLRPLLRLPTSHQSSPDHFSSNPSLLHHLSSNQNQGITLGGHHAPSSGGSGGSSGAGKAGWGNSGAGAGGGGYTGHGRAFLSLPHTGIVDPSSSFTSSTSDEQQRKSSARSALLLKHRLSRQVRTVNLEEGRTVHRQIESRAGSRLGVVDLEDSPPLRDHRRLQDADEAESSTRASIAFPSHPTATPRSNYSLLPLVPHRVLSPSRSSTPSHSRSPSHSSRSGLHRSQSNLDLWQVGVPRQLSLRSISTAAGSTPVSEVAEEGLGLSEALPSDALTITPRSTRPTRPLMDLAGVDLPIHPRHGRTFVRRNSTAYMPQTEVPAETAESEALAEDATVKSRKHISPEKEFMRRLSNVANTAAQVNELVDFYRGPREPTSDSSLPSLQGYRTSIYNECIHQLLRIRLPGQSIAGIVEIYNEMLARDCRPDRITYSLLIEAFAHRDQDVWRAINRFERARTRNEWWKAVFGKEHDMSPQTSQAHLIEGYRAEANLPNAFKLLRAVQLSSPAPTRQSGALLTQEAEHQLLQACAVGQVSQEDLLLLKDLYLDPARAIQLQYGQAQKLFGILGKANDVGALQTFWSVFIEQDGKRRQYSGLMYQRLPAFAQAAASFFAAGEIDMGLQVLEVLFELMERGEFGDFTRYAGTLARPLAELVKQGRVEEMQQVHGRMFDLAAAINPHARGPIYPSNYREILDTLILGGQWREAWPIVELYSADSDGASTESMDPRDAERFFIPHASRELLYAALLHEANAVVDSDPDAALDLLGKIHTINSAAKHISYKDDLYRAHLDVLFKLGRFDDITQVEHYFFRTNEDRGIIIDHLLEAISRAIHREDASLSSILTLRRNNTFKLLKRANHLVPEDALALGLKYLDERKKVASVQDLGLAQGQWGSLAHGVLGYSADEPELDEALLQLAEDFGARFSSKTERDTLARHPATRPLVQRLFHRFGEERATELVVAAFGPDRGPELVALWQSNQRPVPAIDLSGTAQPEGSAVEVERTTAPSDSFILPPPPEYFASLPTLLPGLENRAMPPRISEPLSSTIDADLVKAMRARQRPNHNRLYAMVSEQLNQHYVVPNLGTLNRLIDVFCRVDMANFKAREEAELHIRQLYALGYALLPPMRRHQRAAWQGLENAMIVGLCNLGQLVEAGHHRSRLIGAGLAPSADAYATMIASAKDTTDDAVVATQLWEECKTMGVRPNLYLYNTIISKLSKARKAETALGLFVEMKERGMQPSSVTYGAVINACCRVGDGHSAATLFNEMAAQRNFKPRVPPFNTMMQFHLTTSPNRDAVLHYYNALVSSGISPSAHTYKLLLDSYAVLQPLDLESFERVFAELVADPSVAVQGTHWASLISAHGIYASDYPKALEIFRSIPSHPSASVNLATEPVIWESILNVISQESTVDNLEAMHREMVELGAQATAYVYNILIAGYARAGQIDNARSVFNSMGDSVSGVAAPNNHPQLLTSSGHVKPATITDQPTAIVYREPSTYEAMIRAELAHGTRENAQSVLGMMQGRRYPVAVYMRAENLISDFVMQKDTQINNTTRTYTPYANVPTADLGYTSPAQRTRTLADDPAAQAYGTAVEIPIKRDRAPASATQGDSATSSPTEPSSSSIDPASSGESATDSASSPPTSASTHDDPHASKESA